MIGRPDVTFFPFPIMFVSCFGVIAGLRIMVLFYLFTGMAGMFYLCRHLGVKGIAAVISSVIFAMNGSLAFHIMAGHLGWLSIAYLPWIVFFYLKGLKKSRYLFVSSVFLACMVFEGAYIFIFTVVFLVVLAGLSSLQEWRFRPVWGLGLALFFCVLLSGPKLFPMIELMRQFPRPTYAGEVIPLKNLYHVFLMRHQHSDFAFAFMNDLRWWEFGSYIGIVPAVLFMLSFKLFKERWPLLLTAVITLAIGIGNFSNFAPWTIIHAWPVLRNMHIPSRIFIVFVFAVALLCGLYLDSIKPKSRGGVYLKNAFLLVMLCFLAWDLTVVHSPLFHRSVGSTEISERPVFKSNSFRQLQYPEPPDDIFGNPKSLLAQVFQNRGIIGAYEAIPAVKNAIPYGDPSYRGEFYLLDQGGELSQKYWSPNKLVFHYNIDRPDVLVVNQNYDKSWRTSQKRMVKSHDGLISVELQAGEGQVTLYYFPASFAYGIVSFVAGVLLFIVMIKKKIEWSSL